MSSFGINFKGEDHVTVYLDHPFLPPHEMIMDIVAQKGMEALALKTTDFAGKTLQAVC